MVCVHFIETANLTKTAIFTQMLTWKDMRHTVVRVMNPTQMMRRTSNNQTQTSDKIVWFVATASVARTAKPHVDKGRVCSEEHAATGAHELSAFIYQVDCFTEGAQVVKTQSPIVDHEQIRRERNQTDRCSDGSTKGRVPQCCSRPPSKSPP